MKKGISYFGTRDLRCVKKDLDEIKKDKYCMSQFKKFKGILREL